MPSFLGATHNHFDNYGNYIPGFSGGISLGDSRDLHALLNDGIDAGRYPVLNYLYQNDLKGLFAFANDYGYSSLPQGYFSKCHLCTHIGRYA